LSLDQGVLWVNTGRSSSAKWKLDMYEKQ